MQRTLIPLAGPLPLSAFAVAATLALPALIAVCRQPGWLNARWGS